MRSSDTVVCLFFFFISTKMLSEVDERINRHVVNKLLKKIEKNCLNAPNYIRCGLLLNKTTADALCQALEPVFNAKRICLRRLYTCEQVNFITTYKNKTSPPQIEAFTNKELQSIPFRLSCQTSSTLPFTLVGYFNIQTRQVYKNDTTNCLTAQSTVNQTMWMKEYDGMVLSLVKEYNDDGQSIRHLFSISSYKKVMNVQETIVRLLNTLSHIINPELSINLSLDVDRER